MTISTAKFQKFDHFIGVLNQCAPKDGSPGKVFILDCGGSPLMPHAALNGWVVSGISKDKIWIDEFRTFCEENNLKYGDLIHGDFTSYDCSSLENRYNLLMSAGQFLQAPKRVLYHWIKVVIKGGIIVTAIPNCQAINGYILRKMEPELWNQLNLYSPASFDQIHIDAGLTVIRKAYYGRGIDINMLIPWDTIMNKCPSIFIYKLLRYSASLISITISPFVPKKSRLLNSFLYTMYQK